MAFYVQPHWSQLSPLCTAFTHRNGCTWTATANGIGATTGGRKKPTPDFIHSLVPHSQETDPSSPGWSVQDAVKAASRYGVSLVDRSTRGWDDVEQQHREGHYLIIQGDSDQFGSSTCSGDFDGDHCIGVSPNTRWVDGFEEWFINDGICPDGRWERKLIIKRYAQDLNARIRYASFLSRVPATAVPPHHTTGGKNVTIRYSRIEKTADRMALKQGQIIYTGPGGHKLTSMSKAGSVPHVGLAGTVDGKAWRAVQVGTAAGYKDGKVHRTVGYVPDSAGRIVPW